MRSVGAVNTVRVGKLLVPLDRFEEFEERAAIREFDGGQSREDAERGAARDLGLVRGDE